jgi:mono/diheme cytochrome c family protein
MFHARTRPARAVFAICAVLLLAGCAQRMADQPKIKPLAASDFFPSGQSAQPLRPDTVARGEPYNDELLSTGKMNGQYADLFPFPVTRDVVLRGRSLYDAFCAVCHDRTGSGNGVVVQKGFTAPPVLHDDRLVDEAAGYFFDVITNGIAAVAQMPGYASQISITDRWAIVAYLRALQLSQHAALNDVPPEVRPTLEAQP